MGRYDSWKPGQVVICLKKGSTGANVELHEKLKLTSKVQYHHTSGLYFETKSQYEDTWAIYASDLILDSKLARILYGIED